MEIDFMKRIQLSNLEGQGREKVKSVFKDLWTHLKFIPPGIDCMVSGGRVLKSVLKASDKHEDPGWDTKDVDYYFLSRQDRKKFVEQLNSNYNAYVEWSSDHSTGYKILEGGETYTLDVTKIISSEGFSNTLSNFDLSPVCVGVVKKASEDHTNLRFGDLHMLYTREWEQTMKDRVMRDVNFPGHGEDRYVFSVERVLKYWKRGFEISFPLLTKNAHLVNKFLENN
jgi:hypothetical protein